jgi:hypothetical protein
VAGTAGERQPMVVLADGSHRTQRLSDDEQVALWARCLHAGRPGLVELIVGRRLPDGSLRMRSRSDPRRYPRAGDVDALVTLARRHRSAGEELFATPLARRRPRGGRKGEVLPGAVAWVDIDRAADLERLRAFPHRPHLVVYSGSGGAHAYWSLSRVLEPDAVEGANRRLAGALGGCLSCTAFATILRLPGSHNHKHRPARPATIAYVDLARPGVEVERLVAGLPDPHPKPPPPDPQTVRRWVERSALDDARQVPPPVYFRLLAGVEVPERGGDVRCPLPDHDEQNPSCRVYPTAEQGWCCFGCDRGGSIYDLASLLDRGRGGRRGALHGDEFKRVKRRVHEALGLDHRRPPEGARRAGVATTTSERSNHEPQAQRRA